MDSTTTTLEVNAVITIEGPLTIDDSAEFTQEVRTCMKSFFQAKRRKIITTAAVVELYEEARY